ncbi:AGC (cAMP-dependent, cGMP-dependent and protein kinase C) kinase family protein, putative isoform 1 [Hibiscus syriacus]|uniref:AGC (cAMP-dependent, cGMP-dependent and protein kinase C) kinase family protein, putative isoform 1 n=1 Tax=Hibiscus syriacus TaxID=106335 RepID=A0A6A2YUD0_HIBSY|nr:AGC (cAMP-dependent, cGMP-dependent and protein kinase C) kinase family protein, putative isoform 1 [Hibiscus syriacus]
MGLMVALSNMYEKPSASNKVHLMRRLFNLRMAEGASVAQHLNELNTITTQLSSVEIEFDDEVRALILLSSLPDSWNATVTAVSSSSGNSKLKFDDVRDLVLSEEIRRRESGEASTSSALHTESRRRTSERNSNRDRSKSRRGKSRMGKKDFTCYNCGKKSHFKIDCQALKKDTGAQDSANMTEETGASFHSTPCREIMENYINGDFGKVHLVDDETLKIDSMMEKDIIQPFQAVNERLPNEHSLLLVVRRLVFSMLGRISEKGMKTHLSKGKLPDLKNVDVVLCEDCIFDKQKKVSFTKIGKTLKAKKLELVHTNVWGPSPVPSLAGSLYYITFIDDSTRKVWVYFLKKKSEVFDTFRKWKAMVENETGLKVKRLRSKLDAKSNKCAFVGYGGDEFGYRFWDYENRKIIRSRYVIFNENVMYKKRSTIESSRSNIEAETNKFAEFEESSGNDVQISPEAVQEKPGTLELRRSSRIPKPTQRYSPSLHYLLLTENGEPECYDEAIQVEDSVKWESSMKNEMDSFMSNQTWELVELPPCKKALHNKWIYRIKEEHDGSKCYKARLVVKGFQEKKWYKKFDNFMSSSGFTRCQADHCCYIKRLRHARDYKLEAKIVEAVCYEGSGRYKADSWDEDQERQIRGLMLSQVEYINKVLSMFNMQDAKPVRTALGVHFRLSKEQSPKTPDIVHIVGVVSMYMNNPGKVDADLAGNVDIRRSTTGYVYTLGVTAVSWVSQLQKVVALSTIEAEYVAVTEASKEMVWLQSFLEETKHIQLRYHFIWSLLEDGILKLEKISGTQNPVDMLTKTVTTDKLKLCSASVGMLYKRSEAVRRRRHNWLNSVIKFLVSSLSVCQKKIGTGYLSVFQSELFDRFEAIQPVWAPYYTIYKILAGLLDQYTFSDNSKSLDMAKWMVKYFYGRVRNVITKHSVERHWQWLNEEIGGMNNVLYRLFTIKGDPYHLLLAHIFDKPYFLGLLTVQTDDISGFHANTLIPVVIGPQIQYESIGGVLYKCRGWGGIESFSKLGDSIYFEEEGGYPSLYIIQYIPSILDWKSGNFVLNQKVDPVVSLDRYLQVTLTSSSKEGAKATINDQNLAIPAPDDRPEYAPVQAILYGPYLLSGYSRGDWDIKTGSAGSFADWITLFLEAGAEAAVHATFRLISDDTSDKFSAIGKTVMFEPFDFPGMVLVHQGTENNLAVNDSLNYEATSSFRLVP